MKVWYGKERKKIAGFTGIAIERDKLMELIKESFVGEDGDPNGTTVCRELLCTGCVFREEEAVCVKADILVGNVEPNGEQMQHLLMVLLTGRSEV